MTIAADTGPLDPNEICALLARALDSSDSGAWVLEALREVPGVRYTAAEPKRMFHAATPARLEVGEWVLSVPGTSAPCQLVHSVRGVALQTTQVGPQDAARRLATELLGLARQYGNSVGVPLQSALFGIATALGS